LTKEWGTRSAGLKTLPRVLGFLWEAARQLVISAVFFRLTAAMIPLGILFVSKRIIDMLVNRHGGAANGTLWLLLAAEFLLVACASFCNRATEYCDVRMAHEFSRDVSLRVMKHAAELDLSLLEDPGFHDKLERARVQATDRDVLFSTIGQFLQAAVMLIVMAAALAAYSTWLLAVLVLCALPAFTGESRFMLDSYALARRLTPLRRELDYLRFLSSSRESAKEIRAFGLAGYLKDRYSDRSQHVISETGRFARTRVLWASILGLIA
jgi:ATP-binding cassette, subfamily B, bacterial